MTTAMMEVLRATWPAAAERDIGPVRLRDGLGGGKRCSAALLTAPVEGTALRDALDAVPDADLFQVASGQTALDEALEERGYDELDATALLAAPVAALARPVPPVTAFSVWPPLAIMRELWAATGTHAERQAVMTRVTGPCSGLLGRTKDTPAGVGFVAVHGDTAMVHALGVLPELRRNGLAAHMMARAALWAQDAGAQTLAVAVTRDNAPALALYDRLGMREVGGYHYRQRPSQA